MQRPPHFVELIDQGYLEDKYQGKPKETYEAFKQANPKAFAELCKFDRKQAERDWVYEQRTQGHIGCAVSPANDRDLTTIEYVHNLTFRNTPKTKHFNKLHDICRMLIEGKSQRDIGLAYGLSQRTIGRLIATYIRPALAENHIDWGRTKVNQRPVCPNCGLSITVYPAYDLDTKPAKRLWGQWHCVKHEGDDPSGCGTLFHHAGDTWLYLSPEPGLTRQQVKPHLRPSTPSDHSRDAHGPIVQGHTDNRGRGKEMTGGVGIYGTLSSDSPDNPDDDLAKQDYPYPVGGCR